MTVSGWTNRYLGELVTVQGGFAFKSADFVDDGVPIVRMSDLDNGGLDLDGAARITEKKLKYLSNFALDDGDFLVGMSGSIENYAIVRKKNLPAYLNQRVGRFRLANGELADYDFVTQVARSDAYKLHVELLAAGAAQLNISPTQIESFCFDVPPKPEQTKIAEVLSTVDRAIEQTEALIAKQQRIKTGLMQDLLTRGIDEHGNLRSEETHQFKDSPVGRIPVEWDAISVSSVLSQPPKNGFSPVEADCWNGAFMLGLGCLTVNGFQPNQLKLAPRSTKEFRKALLKPGDFLISRSNTKALVGLVGIYQDIGEPCIYPDLMVRLVFTDDVSTDYMEQVFMSNLMRRQIENSATGTSGSMVKISGALIKGYSFRKPPIQEQHCVLCMLQAQDFGLAAAERNLRKLHLLKTALMQDLLRGKVRITPLLSEIQETHA